MRISGYFKPSELAMFAYLLLTGIIVVLHRKLLLGANLLLAIRAGVFLMVILLAWLQDKRMHVGSIRLVRFVFPLAMLAYLYSETELLNNFLFEQDLDPYFASWEEALFGVQPALAFAERFSSSAMAETMYFGYFSYYMMLLLVPVYIYFRESESIANRTMFIVLHSFFLFYLLFILVPVGGPQFYFTDWPALPRGYVFGPLMRFIQDHGEAPTAAFPSSHVSICIMLILLSVRHAKTLLKFLVPVALLLVLSTVYIRAHYVIDVLAAFVVTPAIYTFSGFLHDKIFTNP
jgi:membrane-associated phospholipid phosphatase